MRIGTAILISYLLVGFVLITSTRVRDSFRDRDVRLGRIPFWKFLAFYTLVVAGALLLWPVFLRSWFGKRKTLLEVARDASAKVVVAGYRGIAAESGCAPSAKTSDAKILEIYWKVLTAFRQASEQRGEMIPAVYLNRIALKFFQVYELMGEGFFEEHLRYEVEKYLSSGLRPEYEQELAL